MLIKYKFYQLFFLLSWLYVLTSVHASEPGVYPDHILIGSSLCLSGQVDYVGCNVLAGMETYFRYINEHGGINGRRIVLKVYDDTYNPPLMIGNVKRLIYKDRVFALISLVGTPTTLTVIDLCEEQKVPLLFPITGTIKIRRPVRRYIFTLRPSYWDECRAAVDYFVKRGKRRFAVFYQRDAYGLDGREGIRRRLLKYDLDVVSEASYLRGIKDVKRQVRKILDADPEVVALIATSDVSISFLKEAYMLGAKHIIFFGLSVIGKLDDLTRLSKDLDVQLFVTQVFPLCHDTEYPAIQEYLTLFKRYFPEMRPSCFSFEGFLNAKLFVLALKKTGLNPTREKFIKTLQNFRNVDLGIGEKIGFSITDHQALHKVFIIKIRDGKIFCLKD